MGAKKVGVGMNRSPKEQHNNHPVDYKLFEIFNLLGSGIAGLEMSAYPNNPDSFCHLPVPKEKEERNDQPID